MTFVSRVLLLSPVLAGGFALAACSQPAPQPEVKETAKTEAPAPAPVVEEREIASHAGEYPSSVTKPDATGKAAPDAAGKVSFLDNPKVRSAVFKLALPASVRGFIEAPSTEVPVFKAGNMIVAHGCEPDNCGAHNWTIAVASDGSKARVCTFESKPGDATGVASWYDGVKPVAKRAEGCPQDAAEYNAA